MRSEQWFEENKEKILKLNRKLNSADYVLKLETLRGNSTNNPDFSVYDTLIHSSFVQLEKLISIIQNNRTSEHEFS